MVLNEWVRMGSVHSSRAQWGLMGCPIRLWAQQLTHVDHSQDVPSMRPDSSMRFLMMMCMTMQVRALHWIITEMTLKPSSRLWGRNPLGEASIGRMRCCEALNFNQAYLGGLSTYQTYLLSVGQLEELELRQLASPELRDDENDDDLSGLLSRRTESIPQCIL